MSACHMRAYICLVRAYNMRACHVQDSVSVSTGKGVAQTCSKQCVPAMG